MRYPIIALAALALTLGCGQKTPLRFERDRLAREVRPTATPAEPMALQAVSVESDSDGSAPMIIRTGQVSIEVDSIDPAVTRVRNLAKAFGGYIGSSSIQRGAESVKTATLVIDVPEERLDGVLGQLNPIGRVESVNMTARDVGEEYVDFEARVVNAKREEQQLTVLLATRTGKLKDVLDLEQELARVQGEIEHYEGHLRYLKAHATMSSLDVTVHEHATVLAEAPGEHPIREATRQAWRNFIGFVASGIASLGVLLPLAALIVASGLIARRLLRRRPSNATT
ncbi:MAG TPA: DUF4349 domain-containing protein [Gemmatimonadaceae bacterium]|nr:DUF4349 domain-containing protein [Gemmatimonadaceae bacterium]